MTVEKRQCATVGDELACLADLTALARYSTPPAAPVASYTFLQPPHSTSASSTITR